MECREAQPFVSVLHDGERVPPDVAEHVDGCAACRRHLADYAEMGVELRMMASRAEANLPRPAWLTSAPPRQGFLNPRILTARVLVPRFALGLGLVAILALSVRVGLVSAQTRTMWFQFQLNPAELAGQPMRPQVAKAGYREPMCWVWVRDNPNSVCAMVSVTAIEPGQVHLAITARRYDEPNNWKAENNLGGVHPSYPSMSTVEKDMGNLSGTKYIYIPGQTLKVPIEGGGVLVLNGQVFDEQPKLAWGYPLTPGPDQLIFNHFAFIRDMTVLLPPGGGSGTMDREHALIISVPGQGTFTVALQPFEGAVAGEAEWSEIHFTIDGHKYFLLSGSPITGGDQPRAIWVSLDANHAQTDKPAYFGVRKLPGK